ncbi:uncharacterized protein JCM15063_004170 [Sporobolomyces koalae]|uniref:uncharacterized protein n=1 Tax=Sporobolomyces koalae TaxID=500713 RepID=UPI0031745924
MPPNSHPMHTVSAQKPRRGRKQDDSLPPSRARDVQRAFRARRAAHLANLEARNTWLEQENLELRHRLGMADDDPPISGPEPELLPLGSPAGSSRGEEVFIKSEEGTSPPLPGWDESRLREEVKDTPAEGEQSTERSEVHSWNARRIDGSQNALGVDLSTYGWESRSDCGHLPPPPGHQHHPFQLMPPPPPHHLYDHNAMAFVANVPVAPFGLPPAHPNLPPSPYEPFPFSWPPAQRHMASQPASTVHDFKAIV